MGKENIEGLLSAKRRRSRSVLGEISDRLDSIVVYLPDFCRNWIFGRIELDATLN